MRHMIFLKNLKRNQRYIWAKWKNQNATTSIFIKQICKERQNQKKYKPCVVQSGFDEMLAFRLYENIYYLKDMQSEQLEFEEEYYEVQAPINFELSPHSGFNFFEDWSCEKAMPLPNTDHEVKVNVEVKRVEKTLQEEKIKKPCEAEGRKLNIIDASLNVLISMERTKNGVQGQTKNLEKILKTETFNYLRILKSTKVLSEKQWSHIKKLKQRNWSFLNFHQIFASIAVRQRILEYFSSPQFVRNLIQQQKISVGRKLQVLKYLQRMRKIINSNDVCRWKEM